MDRTIGRISLRQRERGLVVGGVGSGKSTLIEALAVDFHNRYDNSRELILDSKPRFRAQYTASGRPARRRYKRWDHGPVVPDSVVVEDPDELAVAWSTGARIVIAQAHDGADLHKLVECAKRFLDDTRAGRPQLLIVDETMDFFRANGSPIGSDAIVRTARAGRERGCGFLGGTQRTRGIPATLMEELNKLYLFRLDYKADVKRLWEMGAPPSIHPPMRPHHFYYWTKAHYNDVWGPYALELPEAH